MAFGSMVASAMATIYQPKGRKNLYIKYKAHGQWKAKATQFLPGQEALAEAEGRRLEGEAPATPDAPLTVYAWADKWLNTRSEAVADWVNDKQRLSAYVLPTIGPMLLAEVRPLHLVAVVDAMKSKGYAPRTIRNTYSVIQAMWRDARLLDLTTNDPCILTARQLGKVQDKNLGWRGQAVFTRAELIQLVADLRLPIYHRVLNALLGLGMLRAGEVAGLRWKRVELDTKPLGKLVICTSYDNDTTKTETERWMPIHLDLGTLLYVWKNTGWAAEFGRAPTDDDLVLPAPKAINKGPRKALGAMLDRNWIWKRVSGDAKLLGLRHRRVHDLRRTGISLAIEDGAEELILKRGTHAPPKNVMGLYTTVSWDKLCEEVHKLVLRTKEPKAFGPKVRKVKVPK